MWIIAINTSKTKIFLLNIDKLLNKSLFNENLTEILLIITFTESSEEQRIIKHLDKNIMEKQIILFPFSTVRSISTLYIMNQILFYFSISSSFTSGRTNSSSTIFCLSSSFSSSKSEYSEYSDSSSVFCLLTK